MVSPNKGRTEEAVPILAIDRSNSTARSHPSLFSASLRNFSSRKALGSYDGIFSWMKRD